MCTAWAFRLPQVTSVSIWALTLFQLRDGNAILKFNKEAPFVVRA